MKAEVKKLDSTKREINIEVSGDIVKNKFDDAFKKIGAKAKVPGFRPGHAPRDILEKHYSSDANELVLKDLIPHLYDEAVKKEGLQIVELPEISEVKLNRSSLFFKATVEVSPQIILKSYKGLKVHYKKIRIEPDEVKRSLDSLKEKRKADTLDDNFAKALGYPALQELEGALERQILTQKDNSEREKKENEIIEQLMKEADFKLPQSLVNRQLEDLARQTKLDLAMKGLPRQRIDEEEKRITAELEPGARRQVKVYLILSEIAKKENIPQDEHMPRRVIEFLLKEANWQEIT